MRAVNGIPAEAVSSSPTSFHPHAQGLHLHPDGQGWKTNWGDMATMGKAMYGRWEAHRQAICHDEEATCSSSQTLRILSHPLQAWLRLAGRLTWHLPHSARFPSSCVHSHHPWENWIARRLYERERDERHVWIETETWFMIVSAFDAVPRELWQQSGWSQWRWHLVTHTEPVRTAGKLW